MRILMLSDVFFPRVNGVSTSIKTFRDDLLDMGHRCVLVVPDYPERGESKDDADIVRIDSWRAPFDPEDRLLHWPRLMKWAATLAPGAFDVVHVQTPFAAHYAGVRIAKRIGAPVVETCHTYFELYLHHYIRGLPSSLTKAFARRLQRSQSRAVERILSPSQPMADLLRDYGVRTPITVLPTGLPREAFAKGDRQRFRAGHGIPEDRPVVLFAGRVAHEKNIDFLLRMMTELRKLVPDTLLLIAGAGPAEAHVHSLIRSLGLCDNVRLLGYLDRAQGLPDCYSAADAFVFASRTETQGLVLLEAMAQGTPVVSTAFMGAGDLLARMRGATISPEHEGEFARLTAGLLRNPLQRRAMSQLAETDALAWSSVAMTQQLVDIYAGLAQSPIRGRLEAA
jgi:1,2-diacylglycerol 3-alpha-glucosyltransferase